MYICGSTGYTDSTNHRPKCEVVNKAATKKSNGEAIIKEKTSIKRHNLELELLFHDLPFALPPLSLRQSRNSTSLLSFVFFCPLDQVWPRDQLILSFCHLCRWPREWILQINLGRKLDEIMAWGVRGVRRQIPRLRTEAWGVRKILRRHTVHARRSSDYPIQLHIAGILWTLQMFFFLTKSYFFWPHNFLFSSKEMRTSKHHVLKQNQPVFVNIF